MHQQKQTNHSPKIRFDLNRTFQKIDLVFGKNSFEDMVFLYIARDIPASTTNIFIGAIRLGSSLVCIQRHGAFSKAWKQSLFSPQLKVSRNESYHHLECLYIQ